MLALTKALDEVLFRIPKPILEKVFIPRDKYFRIKPVSLREHILNEVVRPRVMVDCNLMGGVEVFVPLAGASVERINDYTSVYRIPKKLTNGRSIISVLNITFSNPAKMSTNGTSGTSSRLLQAGASVMDAMGSIPVTSTANVQLIGENVVMVRDTIILPANIYLRCMIENDSNLNNLQLKSYRHFSNLVTLAVKAYIYNDYIIPMDLGELSGGQLLGRFKEIVDSYSDTEEQYQTYLHEIWAKVALMNDRERYMRVLKMVISGQR